MNHSVDRKGKKSMFVAMLVGLVSNTYATRVDSAPSCGELDLVGFTSFDGGLTVASNRLENCQERLIKEELERLRIAGLRSFLGSYNFESLRSRGDDLLTHHLTSDGLINNSELISWIRKIEALLVIEPESVEGIGDWMSSMDHRDPRLGQLLLSFGLLGTQQAHDYVMAMVAKAIESQEQYNTSIILSGHNLRDTSSQSIRKWESFIDQTKDGFKKTTLILALGSMISKISEERFEERRRLQHELERRLILAISEKSKLASDYFSALANAKPRELSEQVLALIHDENEDIRHGAVKLFGATSDPTLHSKLMHVALKDPSLTIRGQAIRGLRSKRDDSEVISFFRASLKQENDLRLLAESVDALEDAARKDPSLIQDLKDFRDSRFYGDLRERADRAISRLLSQQK